MVAEGEGSWTSSHSANAWEQLKLLYDDVRNLLIEKHGEEYVNANPLLVTGLMQAMELRTRTLVLEEMVDAIIPELRQRR